MDSSQIEQLVTVIQKLSLARNLDTVIDLVKDAARELTQADGASFVLKDNGHCYYVDENAIAPLWKGKRFPLSICISGWVMNNRQSVIIPDAFQDARIPHAAYRVTFVKSLAVVPIRTLDPIGAIGIYWSTHHQATGEEVELLQALADSTAIALENVQVYEELEERVKLRTAALEATNTQLRQEVALREAAEAQIRHLSLTDELTGLNNRRGFFFLAGQQWKAARRKLTPCLIIFIDLDGLKQANDTYGHEAGDSMIVNMARVLQQTFRDSDVVARLGGDEFVIFATGVESDFQAISARLKTSMDKFNQNNPQLLYHLAASVGVVACDFLSNTSLEEWVSAADRAMYAQKQMKKAAIGN